MESEFDFAAQKHRRLHKLAAQRLKQRQRPSAIQGAGVVGSTSEPSASSSSQSASSLQVLPEQPPHTPQFKVAGSQVLVTSGMPVDEAASEINGVTRRADKMSPTVDKVGGDEVFEHLSVGGPFTCFICVETKSADERFLPHKCCVSPQALCCKPCFVAWAESQIRANAVDIRCCYCGLNLDARILSRLVSTEAFELFCEMSLQRCLRRDQHFIWCSKCVSGGWVDPKEPPSSCGWTCPECSNSFVFCHFCRREHGKITCKRFQQIRLEILEGKAAKEMESEDKVNRSAKFCPSCQMPIVKAGGCSFMNCTHCRRHFCWTCGRLLKKAHQKHDCDAGFETSSVAQRTPNGSVCVELTSIFTNILDVDNISMLNVDDEDLADLKQMLVVRAEPRFPLFVGPSRCDGELSITLPFNFQRTLSWNISHLRVRATHPPAPMCYPPRYLTIIPNQDSVTFSDFEDPSAVTVPFLDTGGILVASLEHLRLKSTFRNVRVLAMRFSLGSQECANAEVFINGLSIFGLPGRCAHTNANAQHDSATLIVSPVVRSRWGEEQAEEDKEEM